MNKPTPRPRKRLNKVNSTPVRASKKRASKKPKIIEHSSASTVQFTNREIGWLNFNLRVLAEAEDSRVPILERLKYLSISVANLDEFFMKRVGGLKRQIAFGVAGKSSDGKSAAQQLVEIRKYVIPMLKSQTAIFNKSLKPALNLSGIEMLKWQDLTASEKEWAQRHYYKNIFPVLTPLSVDPGHPFPFISNLSTSLGVTLKPPHGEEKLFARVKVPQVFPQWIALEASSGGHRLRFVSLIEVIKQNLQDLFPAMEVIGVMTFRLTRNADVSRDEEDAEDLLEHIEEEVRLRRFADVVRLEHGPNPDPWMLKFLTDELELKDDDVYELPEEVDLSSVGALTDLKMPALKFPHWTPVVPLAFTDDEPAQIFNLIRQSDQLLHHPYDCFTATVEKFIRSAADDPKVLAIKMTLYRTGDNSPFIRSLIKAAELGKQVVCLVELKARFDEERNIYWAQALENAGVHVVYGIVGLKTHAKTSLVVRQEAEGLRCYAHIGTGNYNVSTSRFYTDLGLLTANEEITSELVEFFHYLTGRSLKADYKRLLVAPVNMLAKFKFMIEREIENKRKGSPAQIIAKMNNMEENDVSLALYNASSQGVPIDMMVRGFCCVRPGVVGMSQNIRVISTIGRFLEHSRIFYFRNAAADPIDGDFFIGSADWMYRNLHARVECIVPILDRNLKEKIWEILSSYLKDERQTWDMKSDGLYKQRRNTLTGVQQHFMTQALARGIPVEEPESGN